MAKKRKTRQEKIILQLKRELAKQQAKPALPNKKIKPRQEAFLSRPQVQIQRPVENKKADISIFSYDPRLIKKDLIKTLLLTLIALSLEFMLYLRLR